MMQKRRTIEVLLVRKTACQLLLGNKVDNEIKAYFIKLVGQALLLPKDIMSIFKPGASRPQASTHLVS